VIPQTATPAASKAPAVTPAATATAPGASPSPEAASARPTRVPVPTPSLKPGEFITWIKLERPRFAIGEIVVNSFVIVGVIVAIAVTAGLVLGHLRSKRTGTHGTGGLGLR
jgi:hypothetical protein